MTSFQRTSKHFASNPLEAILKYSIKVGVASTPFTWQKSLKLQKVESKKNVFFFTGLNHRG